MYNRIVLYIFIFMLFLSDASEAQFARKKKTKKEEPVKKNRDWNNWEKAREIRSGISTAQRVSQDARGWLNMAKRLGGF